MDSKQVLEIASEIFNTHPTDKDTLAFASALEAALLEGKCLVPVGCVNGKNVFWDGEAPPHGTWLYLKAAPKGCE